MCIGIKNWDVKRKEKVHGNCSIKGVGFRVIGEHMGPAVRIHSITPYGELRAAHT